MARLTTIILAMLTLLACTNNATKKQLTKLEQYVNSADSLKSKSNLFDQIATSIITESKELKAKKIKLFSNDTTGRLKEQFFQLRVDTSRQDEGRVYGISITEYTSDRQAAEAFLKIVEFAACCIPDEDIIKLKNFENLALFKNSASITMLSENLVFEIIAGENNKYKSVIDSALGNALKGRRYIRLEIGDTGPAIWTIK